MSGSLGHSDGSMRTRHKPHSEMPPGRHQWPWDEPKGSKGGGVGGGGGACGVGGIVGSGGAIDSMFRPKLGFGPGTDTGGFGTSCNNDNNSNNGRRSRRSFGVGNNDVRSRHKRNI